MKLFIREWRERRGVTLHDLADKLLLNPADLARIETGRVKPGVSFVSHVAEALGVTPVTLTSPPKGGKLTVVSSEPPPDEQ